jgi:hypothetical protein
VLLAASRPNRKTRLGYPAECRQLSGLLISLRSRRW